MLIKLILYYSSETSQSLNHGRILEEVQTALYEVSSFHCNIVLHFVQFHQLYERLSCRISDLKAPGDYQIKSSMPCMGAFCRPIHNR